MSFDIGDYRLRCGMGSRMGRRRGRTVERQESEVIDKGGEGERGEKVRRVYPDYKKVSSVSLFQLPFPQK